MKIHRKIRLGMVGGGPGGFVGAVHRAAIALDPRAELIAGAFSSNPEKTKKMGEMLFLPEERLYSSYEKMARKEAERSDRIDLAVIAAPNNLHYPAVKAFLQAGIDVVCEKPFVQTVEQAEELVRIAEEKDAVCALTHNYTGYPLVKEAKHLIASGELGSIRMVMAEYPQDGLEVLSAAAEDVWRLDKERGGETFCLGDIGTHVENLVSYVIGLSVSRLQARLKSFSGRELDDDVRVVLEYEGGAEGIYWASKVAPGCENSLKIRVYGTRASLEWEQENPNYLLFRESGGEPPVYITRGWKGGGSAASRATRLPQGHPEGYLESFANIYREIFDCMSSRISGNPGTHAAQTDYDFPNMYDGLRGVKFIHTCMESSRSDSSWVKWD